MKLRDKYLSWRIGYVRFKYCEINWSLHSWALPLEVSLETFCYHIRLLCVSVFIYRNNLKTK